MTLPAALARIPAWLWALACGLIAALAQPPFGLLPGVLAYGGMMLLAERAVTIRGAIWRGWLAGLAYFTLSCWWVAEAFLVDAKTFGWMGPIAAAALAGGLALFWAVGFGLYRALKPKGAVRILVFAGVFSLVEYGRGHLFTGFPWDMPGVTWPAGGPVSQAAALVGAYGLTWVTIALASAPALLVEDWRAKANRIAAAAAVVVLAGLAGWGALRPVPQGSDGMVRIVQPNQPELPDYTQADNDRILADYVALTAQPRPQPGPITVVWPEGAIPDALDSYLAPNTLSRQEIENALRPGDVLMVGGYRVEGSQANPAYYNSLAIFRRDAAQGLVLEGVYDKRHLVPFGEYLPLKPVLHAIGFQKLVPVGDGFSPGPAAPPLRLAQAPGPRVVQPLICYEALFPGLSGQGVRASGLRPELLVNVSTDAWFGATSGPWQHLNQAAYRAIEEGVPMVRATPTGVSAVIDAKGRIIRRLTLGGRGVIDAAIPRPGARTLYSRAGDDFLMLMLAVSLLIWMSERWFRVKIA